MAERGYRENASKPVRQYIPKGTDFSTLTDAFIRQVQYKINRRPCKKLKFLSPKIVFFRFVNNFALACCEQVACPAIEPFFGDLTADREAFFVRRKQENVTLILRRMQKMDC